MCLLRPSTTKYPRNMDPLDPIRVIRNIRCACRFACLDICLSPSPLRRRSGSPSCVIPSSRHAPACRQGRYRIHACRGDRSRSAWRRARSPGRRWRRWARCGRSAGSATVRAAPSGASRAARGARSPAALPTRPLGGGKREWLCDNISAYILRRIIRRSSGSRSHFYLNHYRVLHKDLPIGNVTLLKNDLVFKDAFNI